MEIFVTLSPGSLIVKHVGRYYISTHVGRYIVSQVLAGSEHELARTCTFIGSCYFVYIYFHFSTLIVLFIHNYIEYMYSILSLIFSPLVPVYICCVKN